jgi:hypothetical protein
MNDQPAVKTQERLVKALAASLQARVFETHISWVLVSEQFAWKFKKALRFDFLDFSSRDARRYYCSEEVRLNARLAPDIYLDVIAVTGTPDSPALGGTGDAIEYAVRMRAFDQRALWSWRLQQHLLEPGEIDGLAGRLARFHLHAAVAAPGSAWCTPSALQAIADETLGLIIRLAQGEHREQAQAMQCWEDEQRARLRDVFVARKAEGWIREGHGDLHAANIITLGERVEAFDCIEFNDSLRWIDVLNDLAFACMDLRFRGRGEFAARLLNRYLEHTGDYAGLPLLRYYDVHRALIRCKIALLRALQFDPGTAESASCTDEAHAYLAYAMQRVRQKQPALVIMHGFSGSGKSTLARLLAERLDAIQLRSDVERKRLYGLGAGERGGPHIYSSDATRRTFTRLAEFAAHVLDAGVTAIVDAVFLKREQRQGFAALARDRGVPFFIVDLQASEATMKTRIAVRRTQEYDASDADLAVLESQLRASDPLSDEELAHAILVDAELPVDANLLPEVCERIERGSAGR